MMRAGIRAVLCAAIAAATIAPTTAAGADREWADAALATQYELGSSLGTRNAPWLGTHNSFNSPAEMGVTLSSRDANQQITLTEQLDLGIRSLELDLHWFPAPASGGFAPVVCHAAELHAGCSVEKPLGVVLDEIAGWLRMPGHRDQVLLLYLEDHLDNETGYDTAAATVRDRLGDLLFAPSPSGCTELPGGLTRNAIRAASAQVLIVSDCGLGAGWPSVAYSWDDHEEGQLHGFTDYPACGADYSAAEYRDHLIRYYEDSTSLSAVAGDPGDPITAEGAGALVRCGVDLIGFDQLVDGDPRLRASVWSWAPGQPTAGACALVRLSKKRPFGRWVSRECGQRRPVACRRGGRWTAVDSFVAEPLAAHVCREADLRYAVPRTGREAQDLRLAMRAAGVHAAWIDIHSGDSAWPSQI